MSPVVLILVIVGADRLLSGGRPRVLQPVTRRWLATRPRLLAWIRSAPVTYGYLAILFVTSWVLASASGRLGDRLLLAQSTNLHQLARDPVRVLLSSAFWLSDAGGLLLWAALLSMVLAPVERRVGSWRLGIVFAIGHIGATLLTAAGLWTVLRFDPSELSVVNARDVGASYGFFAVAAAMTYCLAPRLRFAYASVLLISVATVAAISHTFTDFGHLIAVLLGFGCYGLVRGHSALPPIDLRYPSSGGVAWTGARD
ncbi:MAG TPA: rhomboid-like protein [Gaiellaceae bacterium]|nr:rhomboid-like protein [Gaiellaceae bacterium]